MPTWDFFIAHAAVDRKRALDLERALAGRRRRAYVPGVTVDAGSDATASAERALREAPVSVVLVSAQGDGDSARRAMVTAAIEHQTRDPLGRRDDRGDTAVTPVAPVPPHPWASGPRPRASAEGGSLLTSGPGSFRISAEAVTVTTRSPASPGWYPCEPRLGGARGQSKYHEADSPSGVVRKWAIRPFVSEIGAGRPTSRW